jgi:amylosucrase
MYNYGLHQQVNQSIQDAGLDISNADNLFFTRFMANTAVIFDLYMRLYEHHPNAEQNFQQLIQVIIKAYSERSKALKERDLQKNEKGTWFLSNEIA